jgi:iron complex transport system permease protein
MARFRRRSAVFARKELLLPLLFLVLAALALASLLIGRYEIPPLEVLKILLSGFTENARPSTDNTWVVVQILRLPRILLVILSGMGLAVAGASLQGVFRNPLVGPEILGVSAAASFGGVLAMSLGSSSVACLIPSAFLSGCASLFIIFLLSGLARQRSAIGLVLAGVIVSGLFGSLTGVITYTADPESQLPNIVYWLMGSFASASYRNAAFSALVSVVVLPILLAMSWRINILALGDSDAAALGLNVRLIRWTVLILVSLLVATQVAVSGGVGWVGLVVPHLARMLVGPDHVKLLPAAGLLGAIYLLIMDDLARTLMETEIPIGLLTALVGTPFFAVFYVKLQSRGWSGD